MSATHLLFGVEKRKAENHFMLPVPPPKAPPQPQNPYADTDEITCSEKDDHPKREGEKGGPHRAVITTTLTKQQHLIKNTVDNVPTFLECEC